MQKDAVNAIKVINTEIIYSLCLVINSTLDNPINMEFFIKKNPNNVRILWALSIKIP